MGQPVHIGLPAELATGPSRHIEVKGRLKGHKTVNFTHNEVSQGLNQGARYLVALVFVDPEDDAACDGPYYIPCPFEREVDWGVVTVQYRIADLLARASRR